ncbi:MAG: tripartite tricarboxylate transporter substrate binding protein [Betaproteobacteria bacterium]|nr:tripartite tricarboxylate transporter substrate binding protein [Betaproteobacteria bacterium]
MTLINYHGATLLLSAIALTATPAWAQTAWPAKPLRIISPFAPGGGNDTISRILAGALTPRLNQQVVVENRPGANTLVGTEHVIKSPADGYTLILLPNTITINPHLYKKMPFDLQADLAPITHVGLSAIILTVHPSLPVRHTKEFIALARAKPNTLTNGSSGNGSIGHLAGALLDMMAGTSLVHVPYKGTALVMTDLIGGQIVLSFASALGSVPHIRAGRLRGIAITNPRRVPALADLPTIAETIPGYGAELWYALFATAGTPGDIINRLNREVAALLAQPEVKAKLGDQGVDVHTNTPQEMSKLIADELDKWRKVVKATGAQI